MMHIQHIMHIYFRSVSFGVVHGMNHFPLASSVR